MAGVVSIRQWLYGAIIIASTLLLCVLPHPAWGESNALLIGPGSVNVLNARQDFWGVLELRPGWRYYGAGPWFSLEGSPREWYVGTGIFYDLPLGSGWVFTPSLGLGAYGKRHDGIQLGLPLEFRTTLELSYRFAVRHGVAISLGHLSNAELDHINPGTEMAKILYIYQFE